jgi:hypothetical protein
MVDLPAPLGPTRATILPACDGEAQALEHFDFRPRGIGEGDAIKTDIAAEARDAGHDFQRLGRFVEQFAHALGRADGALEIAVEIGEAADRAADEDGVEGDPEKIAGFNEPSSSRVVPYQSTMVIAVKIAKMMKATSMARAFAPWRTDFRKR